MIRKHLFLAMTMFIGATMFMACSDDDSDGQDNPGGEEHQTTTKSLYSHESCDSLIHVAGVEPTDSTDGVFPHWHCDECNRDYVDKDGKVLYKGSPFRPGKCHQIPKELLDKCNASMPWSDMVSTGTTRAGAGAVIQGILKIANVVNNVKFKSSLTSELMEVSQTISTIQYELNQIQAEVADVSSKTDEILQILETLDDQNVVNKTYRQLEWLYTLSQSYYGTIETKINRYTNNGAISVDDLGDADRASLGSQIASVIRNWGEKEKNSDGATALTVATDLLNTFYKKGMEGKTPIPFTEVLKNYVRTYRYWDEAGYYDRMQFLRFYQLSADLAAYLAALYTQNVAVMDEDIRAYNMDALCHGVDTLSIGISADSARMAEAYKHYRVFRNASRTVYLELQPAKASLTQWFEDHLTDSLFYFPDNSKLAPLIDRFLNSYPLNGDFITDDEIDDIYKAGKSYGEDTLSVIFKQHGLDMNPLNLKYPLLFPMRFGHRDNKKKKTDTTTETETAEISGFWVELQKRKHPSGTLYPSYDKSHSDIWFVMHCNIWMNYSHADDNVKHKSDESESVWVKNDELWTIWDLSWAPWFKKCSFERCYSREFHESTPKNAEFLVTFLHYKGQVYD